MSRYAAASWTRTSHSPCVMSEGLGMYEGSGGGLVPDVDIPFPRAAFFLPEDHVIHQHTGGITGDGDFRAADLNGGVGGDGSQLDGGEFDGLGVQGVDRLLPEGADVLDPGNQFAARRQDASVLRIDLRESREVPVCSHLGLKPLVNGSEFAEVSG